LFGSGFRAVQVLGGGGLVVKEDTLAWFNKKKNKKIKEERRGLCRLEDGSYGVNGCGVCLGEKVAVAAGSDSLVWRR
jgi:hypothetical protein